MEEIEELRDQHLRKFYEFVEKSKEFSARALSAVKQFNAATVALDINLSDYTREENWRVTKKLKEVGATGAKVDTEEHKKQVKKNLQVLEAEDSDTPLSVLQGKLKEARKKGEEKPLQKSPEPKKPKKEAEKAKEDKKESREDKEADKKVEGKPKKDRPPPLILPKVATPEIEVVEPKEGSGSVKDKKVEGQIQQDKTEEYKKKLLDPAQTGSVDLQELVRHY